MRTLWFLRCVLACVIAGLAWGADSPLTSAQTPHARHAPTPQPDRITLTWMTDPATSQAVTWRTDTTVTGAVAEIEIEDGTSNFRERARQVPATTRRLDRVPLGPDALHAQAPPAHVHTVNFTTLSPDTLYAYRVGNGTTWSEWFHFQTPSRDPEPFSFLYFGDVQGGIRSVGSRVVRAAVRQAPRARFMIWAGDLTHFNSDAEWGDWFGTSGVASASIPSVPAAGNHEYKYEHGDDIIYYESIRKGNGASRLSRHWRPHFALPDTAVEGRLRETVYYHDVQGVRIIVLNSNEQYEAQADWLKDVLAKNPNRWTVVAFHHPVKSAVVKDLYTPTELRTLWKPLFDRHGVDLVLQGHDHVYARGQLVADGRNQANGPVYVTSTLDQKSNRVSPDADWIDRSATNNTQLYQVVSVTDDTLRFEAYTAAHEQLDAFALVKEPGDTASVLHELGSGRAESGRDE